MSACADKSIITSVGCFYHSSIVAPNVTDGPDSQIVLENDSITFSCVAEGRPPPTVTWLQQTTDQMLVEVKVSVLTQYREGQGRQ